MYTIWSTYVIPANKHVNTAEKGITANSSDVYAFKSSY